jgi:hypothetical protein
LSNAEIREHIGIRIILSLADVVACFPL